MSHQRLRLTHLQRLEAESIHIMREVVAECARPVMMYSIGKDSSVMLHLAQKAFFPGKIPFPLLHIDTTWKFRDMIAFRDETARRLDLDLRVYTNIEGLEQGINPFQHGSSVYTDVMKTHALKQALDANGFDAAFGGARRDEEKSRAKERVFSIRSSHHRWDPKQQRPELWRVYNARKRSRESIRVFPLSNWTELDIWQYIHVERIPIVPLYFARRRPVVRRKGAWIMVDDDRLPLESGEKPELRLVRFRTLGCYPLTAAVESDATSLPAIIQEMLVTRVSEREGRFIDHDQAASMEKKKVEGYFSMSYSAESTEASIDTLLQSHERTDLLRFITCGSVDDGKSTLIGRLLFESKKIFDDQLAALEADSKRSGTRGGDIDFALLVDGLSAEREQGITIDVAYRFFSTEKRKFIVADTPGHEQYTRNMITGASSADLAVILIDARKGVLTQTRRHSYLASLLGIRQAILAINKMDLVDYSEDLFARIRADYLEFAARIGLTDVTCIPIAAVHGHNIVERAGEMPWYDGPTLMEQLERAPVAEDLSSRPFRLPVQWVNRPNQDFRGFAGTIVSGVVRQGDHIRVPPSGRQTQVSRILAGDVDVEAAQSGQSVTLTLADELDVSRGDVLAAADAPPAVADQFEATIVWMHERPMLQGRSYQMKLGTQTVMATVAPLKYKINVNTLEHVAVKKLELNDVGVRGLALSQPIVFEPYSENRDLGGFILIDRVSNATVGAGLLHFALRRSQNVHWQALDINKGARSEQKGQRPCVVWFTGLSGAGKSTIANLLEKQLHAQGCHTYILDGDNVRHGLNKDLGFTDADRVENIRRVAEVARLMVDAGLIVLVSFISPFRAERRMARNLVEGGEFVEVFVDTPLEVAESRDPKGLFKKARRGELKNFTGIDSPYEAPENSEMRIDTTQATPEQAVAAILTELQHRGVIDTK